tara:strand:- start:59 stop:658 length:600 start_codon:yes stop_codon:yes gene_type:complete
MANIITASNSYKLRPLVESDQTFLMESLADFPIGSNSYQQRINEFSNMLYVTGSFTKAQVTAETPTSVTMVLEKADGTEVAFNHYQIKDLVIEVKMGAVHPSHRGQKHYTAQQMLGGYFAYIHLGCTQSIQEAVNTAAVTALADNWRPSLSVSETTRTNENKFGDSSTYTLSKIAATAAEHETYRAAHSTWGSITYAVS